VNWGFSTTSSAGGALNDAGNQSYAQAQWAYTNQHVQIAIQGSAIDQTKGDALSVANVVDEEVSGAVNDLNRNLTRQIFSDGDAVIAQCGTTTSSTTVQLNTTSGYDAIERGWLGVGAKIDIGTAADGDSIADGREITAVDLDNRYDHDFGRGGHYGRPRTSSCWLVPRARLVRPAASR
jgi:hypothetical protein